MLPLDLKLIANRFSCNLEMILSRCCFKLTPDSNNTLQNKSFLKNMSNRIFPNLVNISNRCSSKLNPDGSNALQNMCFPSVLIGFHIGSPVITATPPASATVTVGIAKVAQYHNRLHLSKQLRWLECTLLFFSKLFDPFCFLQAHHGL